MRWLRAVSVTCALSLVLSGCMLRPRYQDLTELSPGEGPITVQLVNAETGAPLAAVPVSIGEGAGRFKATTDDQGRVTIPRDARMKSLNALIIVDKPKGVNSFRFQQAPAQETQPSKPAEQVPTISIPDGGVGPGQPPGMHTPSHSDSQGHPPAPTDAGTSAQ